MILQLEYVALESMSQDYGFELLGMCREQSEVTAVLNDLGKDSDTGPQPLRKVSPTWRGCEWPSTTTRSRSAGPYWPPPAAA